MSKSDIRPVQFEDLDAVTEIYNYYVEHDTATFEEAPIDVSEMAQRVNNVRAHAHEWWVADIGGEIRAYAYATPWRPRTAYRFAVEVTVYVAKSAQGLGLGSALYSHMLEHLKEHGVRTAIGVVTLPNPASQALHEKLGFKQVGRLEKVGLKFDRWLDVGYWQIQLI